MKIHWKSLALVLFIVALSFSGCSSETEHRIVGVWQSQGDSSEAGEDKLKGAVDDSLKTGESNPEISISPDARLTIRGDGSYDERIEFWGLEITTEGTWEIVSEDGDQLEIKLHRQRNTTIDAAGKKTEQTVNKTQNLTFEFQDSDTITMTGTNGNGNKSTVEMKRQKK